MRLVDADALKSKIEQSGGEGTIAMYCKRVLAECLDNDAPTIDAIPVEWLQAKIKELRAMGEYQNDCADSIWFVVMLWQKEQEAR